MRIVGFGFLAAGLLVAAGCVRPQYDMHMGAANLLAADAFDAGVDDLAADNAKLRDIKIDAAFALVEVKAASGESVSASDLQKLHQGVRTDQAERAVIAEIVRKARAASSAVRLLGQRSQAIGLQEQRFLNSIGAGGGQ
ncbi:MAG TPA: hypothetical protein VLM89_17405 [Phycisphaerae bacterium]|nr:hypothetical protein [Phycisphaerae bacterium]